RLGAHPRLFDQPNDTAVRGQSGGLSVETRQSSLTEPDRAFKIWRRGMTRQLTVLLACGWGYALRRVVGGATRLRPREREAGMWRDVRSASFCVGLVVVGMVGGF